MKAVMYYSGSNADVRYYIRNISGDSESSTDETNFSRVNDAAINAGFSWQPRESHNVRFGASYQFHIYNPSRTSTVTELLASVHVEDSPHAFQTGGRS